jgi:ketosteroid isomerase-like protein
LSVDCSLMGADEALELGIRYRDAFFARDIDGIMALVTPDFVFENVTAGERVEGAEAARVHIAAIHARWPDMRFEEREGGIRAGGGHVVAEWTALATHPDTGRVLQWDGIDLIQVREGRICRNAVYSSAHAAREIT